MWNARMDESQAGRKIPGRKSNNLRYVDSITAVVESEEELKKKKSLFIRVKKKA